MKNDNFDFIKAKLDEENISSPEELSEDNIKARLEKGTSAKNIIKFKQNNKRFFKSAVSIAAAIALVVVSISAVNHYQSKIAEENKPKPDENGIVYFTSYDEIDSIMKDRLEKPSSGIKNYVRNFSIKGGVVEEYEADGVAAQSTTGATPSHSDTYKQVEAVDEADIVKTDGKYIYFLSENGYRINICSADDGKTKKLSTMILDENQYAKEMFVFENTLVVISTEEDFYTTDDRYVPKTVVNIYDISDKNKPKELDSYSQSGYYTSARMLGSCIYLVTDYSNYYYVKNCFPCATDASGAFETVDYKSICAIEESDSGSYTVIGAMDVSKGSRSAKTRAVLGTAGEIYCNENNLYVTGCNYNYATRTSEIITTIVKYSLDKTDIKLTAAGKVRGNVNDQFSMDEKDGFLRVATTAVTQSNKDINLLYVLDDKLSEVGRVKGFARNEHIEAVRYIGDMAYVITYERTDPLFIINLSDPENPEILGEVKISGFSTMLVPIDEKNLLGIGYSTEENEFGEATNGLKLALFDIGNPAEPKVLDEKEFEEAESPVQYNHKALVQNREEGYFVIPVNYWYDIIDEESESENANGALVFSVKNGKIKINKKHISPSLYRSDRCVFIENYIYVIDTMEEVIDSFEF